MYDFSGTHRPVVTLWLGLNLTNNFRNYSVDAKSGIKTTEGAERRGKRRFQSRIPRYSAFSVVNSLILCNTTE
ncbi:MAG: hypothetical protein LBS86_00970 [Treponema sp.]|jgi:hypothetical protein|nr:hypothetical protein [Treponema sp.]